MIKYENVLKIKFELNDIKVLRNGWGHEWLPSVWDSGEIDSVQYETPGRLTQRSMILRGDWLSAVWDSGEIDSAQYDTAGLIFDEKFD